MCQFFSFVTEPDEHPNGRFYFNWEQRQKDFSGADSHDHIISFYMLDDMRCNSYEYNPLTGMLEIDQQNSQIDDRVQAEEWVRKLDFKKIIEPLIIKPIIHPFKLPKVKRITREHKRLLKNWASVWASVRVSAWYSAYDSAWSSAYDSVVSSVYDSVWASVRVSAYGFAWSSVRAYSSSFFDITYPYDFTSVVKLWESGLVPSFDGKTWRLHSGEKAEIVYEMEEDK